MSDPKPHVLVVSEDFEPTDLSSAFELEHHPNCPTDLFEFGENSYTDYGCMVGRLVHQFGIDFFFAHADDPNVDDGRVVLTPGTHRIDAWTEYTDPWSGGGGEWECGLYIVEPEAGAAPSERIDVDAILASLGPEFDDPGDNPWGGANLEKCGDPACRCVRTGGEE